MSQNFEISWKISEEGVPGGLKVGAHPKSYSQFKDMFDSAKEVRKIDDLRELRIQNYMAFSPFEFQRESVLRMLGRFRGKGIFGDQVGLGKTVEVGMTVAEFAERNAVRNVLLLCPHRLGFQWKQEIDEKFSGYFKCSEVSGFAEIRDAEAARTDGGVVMYLMSFQKACSYVLGLAAEADREIAAMQKVIDREKLSPVKSELFTTTQRAVQELSALRAQVTGKMDGHILKLLDYFTKGLAISMLIVDESDALLAAESNKTLQIYTVTEHIARSVSYKILMSATPIRRQLGDVYQLMRIVRPEQFRDKEDFIKNYCFGKEYLSDFEAGEISKLKGIIDQLFTRNRLAGRNVQNALKPLAIEDALKINYRNFANPNVHAAARDAVWEGLLHGESGGRRNDMAEALRKFGSLNPDEPDPINYWVNYIRKVYFRDDRENRPTQITPEKNKVFGDTLLRSLEQINDIDTAALRFALTDYVIPPKNGHLILYRGKGGSFEEVEDRRQDRRIGTDVIGAIQAMAEQKGGSTRFDKGTVRCDNIYVEFDVLVSEMLPDEKVVVFSDTSTMRDTFIKTAGKRALDAKGDSKSVKYLQFKSDDPKFAKSIYFAVNGQEKGVNFQFCNNLIITSLSHDPNLVEQIVGRISRINQKREMHVYVFAEEDSLEHYLYDFYNEVLHLFTDWDGDNTFIIGGAVSEFLDRHGDVRRALQKRLSSDKTEDGEFMEIGFTQIVEYLYERCLEGTSSFKNYPLWNEFVNDVSKSMETFKTLVKDFGEQEDVRYSDDR